MTNFQGWEFTHSLIAHSLIHSLCSNKMSDCERIAQVAQVAQDKWALSNHEQINQVAHDKWATVSNSLRSLIKYEQFAQKNFLTKYKI